MNELKVELGSSEVF